jgi:beta-lactamase regulating signal transducer with metallopeptidase domain
MNQDSLVSIGFFILVVLEIAFIASNYTKYFEKYFVPVMIIIMGLTAYFYFRYLTNKMETLRRATNISTSD